MGASFDPHPILSNFGLQKFFDPGGGVLFGRDLFCGKFDETSFCAGPGLISFFVSEIEAFKDFSLLKFRHLAKFFQNMSVIQK